MIRPGEPISVTLVAADGSAVGDTVGAEVHRISDVFVVVRFPSADGVPFEGDLVGLSTAAVDVRATVQAVDGLMVSVLRPVGVRWEPDVRGHEVPGDAWAVP